MTLPILARRHAIGSSLWLWSYLAENTKAVESEWMPVADGMWISDTQLGFRIDVGEATIRRWRKKLMALGYIYVERVRPRYRKFWIANPNPPVREQGLLQAPASGLVN